MNVPSSFDTFKGWAIPGPKPESPVFFTELRNPSHWKDLCLELAQKAALENPPQTLDALSGHFKIYQYKDGHRFSTDDLLVAWYGTTYCPRADRVLDLGSGIGTVALVSAWRLPGAKFVTIEAQDISIALARKSIELNGLTKRFDLRLSDFRDPAVLKPDEHFDLITGSPPYFPIGTGVLAEHPQKVACRFEVRGHIGDYCRVASEHLAPGGVFAAIFPYETKQRVEEGAREAGLTMVRTKPIVFREDEPPLLWLFLMMKREHLPEDMWDQTWNEPPLIIRAKDGSIHPEYRALKLSFGFPP